MVAEANREVKLSPAQLWPWSTSKRSKGDAANVALTVSLEGAVSVPAIELAIWDVIARHDRLRTGIRQEPGEPLCHLHDGPKARPALRVLKGASDTQTEMTKFVQRNFELADEVPVRAALIPFSEIRHILLFAFHPQVIDSYSVRPFVTELAIACSSRCAGVPPRWPGPASQYMDYVRWLGPTLGDESDPGSRASRQVAFWTKALRYLPEHVLPNNARPEVRKPSEQGGTLRLRLNPGLHARLLAVAASGRASLLMLLHAAIAVALASLGSASDIPVATIVSGRKRPEFRHIVGPLANVLLLRTAVDSKLCFSDLLARVRQTHIAAYENDDLPWNRVLECISSTGDSYCPPVMLNVQKRNRHQANLSFPNLRVKADPLPRHVAGSELAFDLWEWCSDGGRPGGIEGKVRYDSSKVDPDFVKALLARVGQVLRSIAAYPSLPIAQMLPFESSWPRASGSAPAAAKHASTDAMPFEEGYTQAQHVTHDRLIQIWESLLGVSRIGIWDDFKELGGDSRLFHRIRETVEEIYRRQIPASLHADGLTVAKLADELIGGLPHMAVHQVGTRHAQANTPFWFLHGDFNGGGLYCWELQNLLDTPLYALPPHGKNGLAIRDSVESMADDYIELIRQFQGQGPYYLGGYCAAGLIALEIAQRLRQAGDDVAALILVDSHFVGTAISDLWWADSRGVGDAFWRYMAVACEYAPKFYAGKISLLYPAEKKFASIASIRKWRTVAGQLDVQLVAGGHSTCLTRYIAELSAALKMRLNNGEKAREG